jgi:hypothetical protein
MHKQSKDSLNTVGLPFIFWRDMTTALRGSLIRRIPKKLKYEKCRIAIHAPTGLHLHTSLFVCVID